MELLGKGSLFLALALAVWAGGAGWYGARTRDRRIVASAERALVACFAAVAFASAVLLYAYWTHDFRFEVVADTSSRRLPDRYVFSAFWASQPGSLLLWALILTGFSALAVRQNRRSNRELAPWVTAILGGTSAFFTLALVAASSPFKTLASTPIDGNGLNPALQNPYMMIHPPMLYLGFVGFSVPYAFAMAALLAGRTDERWIVSTRRWTLAAWGFLGVGMLLGSHWAYEEVGWGGFWAWDAVENAALLPWLVGTAFLHSVIVQEKKGMLKVWNVSLISLTFGLCLFGTFLTRSGILSSIHSFIPSNIGWWFITFIAIVAAFSTVLILRNLPLLRARHRMESLVSREATFLFNNLLFVAFAFAVLWGTLFPIVAEAVRGETLSVSSPFFEFFAVVFGLPILFLAGVGPIVAWRRASARSVGRAFLWPFLSAAALTVILIALGFGESVPAVVALSLCLFVTVTVLLELARGTVARRALSPGLSWPRALGQLIARNRRRYGGYIVHLAIVVAVVGMVATSAYSTVTQRTLAPGQAMKVDDYTLRFDRVTRETVGNSVHTEAVVTASRNGAQIGVLHPAKRFYTVEGQTSNEVDIKPNWRNGEDLYTRLDTVTPRGEVTLTVLVNPLVNLLWLSGFIFVAGVLVAIWPDPREARRLARRFAEEPLPREAA